MHPNISIKAVEHPVVTDQRIAIEVLAEKYAFNPAETKEEGYRRVAKAIAAVEIPTIQEDWEERFFNNFVNGAVGGGRIMSSAGTGRDSTLINCFVQPISDCIKRFNKDGVDVSPDGGPGIYDALADATETMRRGGGVGYNFSKIRPKFAVVNSVDSFASGPCSFMDVFDKNCKTVEGAGCFAPGTLIDTTEGLVRIEDIVNSDKDWYVNTHVGVRKVTTKFNNGRQTLLRLTLESGYSVDITPSHKFAQHENGKIVTKTIRDIWFSGNRDLLLLCPNGKELIPADNIEEKVAYLIGMFYGNGSYLWNDSRTKVKGITICNGAYKTEVLDKVVHISETLGFKVNYNFRNDNDNSISIGLYSAEYFREWYENGIQKHGQLHIPDVILQGSENVRASFIAGLMDAYGSISESKSNIRLRMVSKELLQECQIVLSSLGVPSVFNLEREAVNNWQAIYLLGIYGQTAQVRFNNTVGKFMAKTLVDLATRDRVGYGHPWSALESYGFTKSTFAKHWSGNVDKNPKVSLNAIVNSTDHPDFINTVTLKAVSLEFIEDDETYDLEVEEVHLLSGNGIYTSNSRRGAQMGVLDCDHPDVEEFIDAKHTKDRWVNFNVSVMVNDAFMRAVKNDDPWELVHIAKPSQYIFDTNKDVYFNISKGKWVYKTIRANDLWKKIIQSTYDIAEPGVLFSDTINRLNNLRYVEHIAATNPCAEQPLPPYGCCDLGSLNLTKFVKYPFTPQAYFDDTRFEEAVKIQVRLLDNVLDVTNWPLHEQRVEAENKRRIGVGFIGLGNALAMLNIRYDSDNGRAAAETITRKMAIAAYTASTLIAVEKGSFPLFNAEQYLAEGTFASTLPDSVKALIRDRGLRNSHLLSIAPTGTISLAYANNASNGIEPPFSWFYNRKKRTKTGETETYELFDYSLLVYLSLIEDRDFADRLKLAIVTYSEEFEYRGLVYKVKDCLPDSMVTALEMGVNDHADMVAAVQKYIDTSISKTINVPADYPFEDFEHIYMHAWESGLKGVATYRPNNTLGSVLSVNEKKPEVVEPEPQKSEEELYNEFLSTRYFKRPKGRLRAFDEDFSYVTADGEVKFYITIAYLEQAFNHPDGGSFNVQRPIQIFVKSNCPVRESWIAMFGISISRICRGTMDELADYLHKLHQLDDGCKIRLGTVKKGKPRFHDGDIAAHIYAIQYMLHHIGVFDEEFNVLSYQDQLKRFTPAVSINVNTVSPEVLHSEVITNAYQTGEGQLVAVFETVDETQVAATGTTCRECGAPSVVKRDGCKVCENCGWEGGCG